jgi:deoxyribose-phosphate aldolase
MTSSAENPVSVDRASKPLALQGRARVGDRRAAHYEPTGIGAVERFQAGPGAAACIDRTLLKPGSTADQNARLCAEARQSTFAAVRVDPQSVSQAAAALTGSPGETPCVVGPASGVKASGGIRRQADAEAMWTERANRLGTSSGVAIVQQALQGRLPRRGVGHGT